MTPNTKQSPPAPPNDAEWIARHWKTIAAAASLLAAAGYTVISPTQRVDALGSRMEHVAAAQSVRDSVQSVRIDRLEVRTDTEIREVRRSLDLLMLSGCFATKDARLRAQMECRRRMDGSPIR